MWQRLPACAHPNSRTAKPERPARSRIVPHAVMVEAPMTEQIIGAVPAKPAAGNGTPGAVPRDTNTARGLPPNTWLNRNSTIEYVRAHGSDQRMRGVYLDHFPDGLAMNAEGARTLARRYRLCVVELAGS
jgi:hypothetical protein